jgi:hypothetical protein
MLGIVTGPHRAATMTMPIVQAFDLWFTKNRKNPVTTGCGAVIDTESED